MENANPVIESLKKEINELKGKITTLEEKKEELVNKRNDLISKTVLSKKAEIENTYGEILLEAEKRLEVSKKEKEKERKKNISELVDKNTKEIKEKILFLKNEIKRLLKENKIPGIVNSEFYYIIWAPYNFLQVLKGLFFNILLLIIPTIVVFFPLKEKIFANPNKIIRIICIICVYLAFIFVYSLIWLMIDKLTKKKPEILNEIKELRKNIKENEKEMEKVTKKITKETKDEEFDYTKIDRDIESGEIEVNNLKEKKKIALETFANVTEDEIKKKFFEETKADIEEKEKEIESTKEILKAKQKECDELRLKELNDGNNAV